jgi:hypothetical protein
MYNDMNNHYFNRKPANPPPSRLTQLAAISLICHSTATTFHKSGKLAQCTPVHRPTTFISTLYNNSEITEGKIIFSRVGNDTESGRIMN